MKKELRFVYVLSILVSLLFWTCVILCYFYVTTPKEAVSVSANVVSSKTTKPRKHINFDPTDTNRIKEIAQEINEETDELVKKRTKAVTVSAADYNKDFVVKEVNKDYKPGYYKIKLYGRRSGIISIYDGTNLYSERLTNKTPITTKVYKLSENSFIYYDKREYYKLIKDKE